MINSEKIFSLVILAFGVIGLYESSKLSFLGLGGGIGPGFFPLVLSSLIILLSIIYFLGMVINKKEPSYKKVSRSAVRLQIWFAVALVICLFLIPKIGMLTCFVIFSFLILFVLEKKNWYTSLLFSFVTVFLMFMIFEYFLGMTLPKGLLM